MRLPNNYGCVYKLPGNRRRPYVARKTLGYKDNGSAFYKIIGYYPSRSEALNALAVHNKTDDVTPCVTLASIFVLWLNDHSKNVAPSTVSNFKGTYRYLTDIATVPIQQLKNKDLQGVINNMLANGLSYSSAKKCRSLISQLYKYAIINEIIDKAVYMHISIGKNKPVRPHKPFTRNKITKIWKNYNKCDYLPLILLYTGMRSKELRDLKKSSVNLKNKTIKITSSKTKSGIRTIPIHEKILPIIYELMATPGVYLLGEHMTYSKFAKIFKKSMLKINAKHTTHDCRHTFATMLDSAGANQVARRMLLGHANGDVTDKVYTHKTLKQLRKTIHLLK